MALSVTSVTSVTFPRKRFSSAHAGDRFAGGSHQPRLAVTKSKSGNQAGGPFLVSGFVGPDEQARHWRDGVLGVLARRGTVGAVRVLRRLAESHPGIPSLEDLTRKPSSCASARTGRPSGPRTLPGFSRTARNG
jgi:hypothetical protein